MTNWNGPYSNADEALDQLRRSVAELLGADPATWPEHGNAPLAIAAAIAGRINEVKERGKEIDQLRAELDTAKNQEPVAEVVWMAGIPNSMAEIQTYGLTPPIGTKFYAAPVPERIPRGSIEKILNEVMDIAVKNGANSISMPDEYVEVAAWLCGIPKSVPEEWQLVPKDIHPMSRTDCSELISLLANPPWAKPFDDENDFYASWWAQLLAAAPKPEETK